MRNDRLASRILIEISCDVVKNVPSSDPCIHRATGEQFYVFLLARMKAENRQACQFARKLAPISKQDSESTTSLVENLDQSACLLHTICRRLPLPLSCK